MEKLKKNAPAILIFIAVMALWEGGVRAFQIERFLLPKPSAILQNFIENYQRIISIGWYTTKEALGGFAMGCTLGISAAFITSRWTALGETMMPFAIAANSVPILAIC